MSSVCHGLIPSWRSDCVRNNMDVRYLNTSVTGSQYVQWTAHWAGSQISGLLLAMTPACSVTLGRLCSSLFFLPPFFFHLCNWSCLVTFVKVLWPKLSLTTFLHYWNENTSKYQHHRVTLKHIWQLRGCTTLNYIAAELKKSKLTKIIFTSCMPASSKNLYDAYLWWHRETHYYFSSS